MTDHNLTRLETRVVRGFQALGIDVTENSVAQLETLRTDDDGIHVPSLNTTLLQLQQFCERQGIRMPTHVRLRGRLVGVYYPQ